MQSTSLFALPLTLLLVAGCGDTIEPSSEPPDFNMTKDQARAAGGKADGFDYCELLGWYGDKVCDDFCPKPDPDCGSEKICASQGGVCDPAITGGLSLTRSTHKLKLPGGLFGTTIPLSIYMPRADGTFPVVVFHHGFQLSKDLYASYGRHLASWGHVVIMPQMPGGPIGGPNHRELKDYLVKILDWVVANAKDKKGPIKGKADASRVGLAGHSMGGKISMLTATEDVRPLAVFTVDPVDAVGSPFPVSAKDYPSVTPELMHRVTVPLGLLGETTNATCKGWMCQACAPKEDNFQQYFKHAKGPAIQIEMLGASHMSFLDNPKCGLLCSVCPSGKDDTDKTRVLTQRYMTAFFNVHLRGWSRYRTYLTGSAMTADKASGLVKVESKNGF